MIKLLIADDEAIIRKGMRHHIDWGAHGIEVVGEAADGRAALGAALALQPDIVLADIRMPLMTGLEMADELHRLMPHIHVILLSGYSDKEYLMQAIKSGVDDYVMKTANTQDILSAVLAAKERIRQEQSQLADRHSSSEIIEQNYLPIRKAFLQDLVGGVQPEDILLERAAGLDIALTGPAYLLLALLVDPAQEHDALMALLFHFDTYHPFIVPHVSGRLTGVLNMSTDCATDVLEAECERVLQRFREQGVGVKLYLSTPGATLAGLADAHNKTLALVEQSCWDTEYSAVFLHRRPVSFSLPLDMQLQLEGELLDAFSSRSAPQFEEKLSQFHRVLQNHRFPFRDLQESGKRIAASMYRTMSSYEQAYTVIAAIGSAETVQEILGLLRATMRAYAEGSPKSSATKVAADYIGQHFQQPIQLAQVARQCYITPSYLSRIFKEEMKVGVVQYIHQVRIEKAKELLTATDDKVADIATQVGYANYKQFSAHFLKICGVSPREYRAPRHWQRPDRNP